MRKANMIMVNGEYIPNPTKFMPYPNLREKSSENSLGDLIRKIISSRWKLEQNWDVMSREEYTQLERIKFLKEFDCAFPAGQGTILNKKMYAGDLKGEACNQDENGVAQTYKNVTCNFIQTKADKYTGGAV